MVIVRKILAAIILIFLNSVVFADDGPPQFTKFPIPTPASGSFNITAGPDGNLWFAEFKANKIAKMTLAGSFTEYPVPTANSSPFAITAGPDGNLWFTEVTGNKIGRITTSGVITEFPLPTAQANLVGIAAGADGNLWFAEAAANKIGRITPAGIISEFALPTANSIPVNVTAGPDGNIWFISGFFSRIGKVTPSGAITEFSFTGAGGPTTITTGPDRNLWFTDLPGNKIWRYDPTTNTFTSFPADGSPFGIATGSDNQLYVTAQKGDYVGRVDTATGAIVKFPIDAGSGASGITAAPGVKGKSATAGSGLLLRYNNVGTCALVIRFQGIPLTTTVEAFENFEINFTEKMKVFLLGTDSNNVIAGSTTDAPTIRVGATVDNLPNNSAITAVHIHEGPAGVNGPVIADFLREGSLFPPTRGHVELSGTVNTTSDIVQKIVNNPGLFYGDVHMTADPNGVCRGQLALTSPAPNEIAQFNSVFQADSDAIASLDSVSATKPLLTADLIGAQQMAQSGEPFGNKKKAFDALVSNMKEARDRPATSAHDKGVFDKIIGDVGDILIKLFQAAQIPLGGGGANLRPAAGCKCTILVLFPNGKLEPRTTLRTFRGDIDKFKAFCDPAGGKYDWDFQPADRAGIASSTSVGSLGNTASFTSERIGNFQVTVRYMAPDGSKCEAVLQVVEQ
ncbi:MAG TPA: CHRD domain-containing protein [Acidobacteriota bacterium]